MRLLFRDVVVFDGSVTMPGTRDVLVDDGRITAVAPARSLDDPASDGGVVLPGLIDAHVHLSFFDAEPVVAAGVTGALDLGAPGSYGFAAHPPLRYRAAGPLLTSPGGYPTRSWGAGGYGLEIGSPAAAREAVSSLVASGAAMIKVAVDDGLGDAPMRAVTEAARVHGIGVVAHALSAGSVARAVEAGIDMLAHTPVEPLPESLVARIRSVVSTVRAFGSSAAARANLSALARAGCRVAYGTDLGNDGISPGADPLELAILEEALGSRDAALAAATSEAASFAGFPAARIAEGDVANLIVCDSLSFDALRSPRIVLIDGVCVR